MRFGYAIVASAALACWGCSDSSDTSDTPRGGIASPESPNVTASFDIVRTEVRREGDFVIFRQEVRDAAGAVTPNAIGVLAGSEVFSYVWPTSINSEAVGFDKDQGILAFVLTSHPDFDDTPREDENGDGDPNNDGGVWHSHWVVLTEDASCAGGLKVRDIPEGTSPRLPPTWPNLPILIDSPGFVPTLSGEVVEVRVPVSAAAFPAEFNYDGVTAALRVNADLHQPLLCVTGVNDVASGDLSLPGKVK